MELSSGLCLAFATPWFSWLRSPFRCWFAGMLGIIVPLHDPMSAQLKLQDRLSQEYSGIRWSSLLSQWLPVFHLLRWQNKPKSSHRQHHAWQLVWVRCLRLYAVFSFCQTLHCAWWPNISTMVSSTRRILFQMFSGFFSDAILQIRHILLYSFKREGALS